MDKDSDDEVKERTAHNLENVKPHYYDTKQNALTILLQVSTETKSRHQYMEGTQNSERRMIDRAKQALPIIQEMTN